MSEHESDNKATWFAMGFITGVLVCLGAGIPFLIHRERQSLLAVEASLVAREHAALALRAAEEARRQAEAERSRAVEAEKKARAAVEQVK